MSESEAESGPVQEEPLDSSEFEDQDAEPTNTAPPGERPTDPEATS
jgi:hypothetical protein